MTEDMPTSAINPYGWLSWWWNKFTDVAASDPSWSVTNLRYFNLSVLMKVVWLGNCQTVFQTTWCHILQVAIGKLLSLTSLGWLSNSDGSGVRDIHVLDLASGHLAAVKYNLSHKGAEIFNLVLDMVIAYWISLRLSKLKTGCYSIPYSRTSCWWYCYFLPLLKRPKKFLAGKLKTERNG